MQTILECKELTKAYDGVPALFGINLALPKGRIIGLLGPNGSGKTTFIKLAAGLLKPTSGEITVDGKKPGIETKAMVSYLPDKTYAAPWMKVCDIIDFFADFYSDFDKSKAHDMLKRLGVESGAKLKTLSKGTMEKVQLILVMSRGAKLYLLDEPIGGVDPAARDFILETIISNYGEGATVLISTHLIYDIEKTLDEFLFLKNGRIIMQGETKQITEQGTSLDGLFREVFKC